MKMKKIILLFALLLLIVITSCSTDDDKDGSSVPPPSNIENRIVFWSNFPGEPINVFVEGQAIGTITSIGSETPACGSSGNVTRTYNPGTYSYTARENGGDNPLNWSGTFTIDSNVSCLSFLLRK